MSRIEELERRVHHDPASFVFGALAEEYRRAGRLEEAIATCRAGLERHPSSLSARVTLGRALQAMGELAEARAEFEHVIAVAPDNLAAIRALAELHGDPAAPAAPAALVAPASPGAPASPALPALESWLLALEREREQTSGRL